MYVCVLIGIFSATILCINFLYDSIHLTYSTLEEILKVKTDTNQMKVLENTDI